jgi:hypothetical protein
LVSRRKFMTLKKSLLAAGVAAAITIGISALAMAHGPGGTSENPSYGWHYGWHMGPMMGPGYGMGQGMGPGMGPGYGMGPGMTGQGQMGPGYGMGQGMTGQGQMGPGYGMGQGMTGQGQMGPGYGMGQGMGPGMGPGYGMGPGMTGQGQMGPGYGMGQGMTQPLPRDLSADDVKHMIEHQLAWQGNPNVKVGNVQEKDDDTIVAEIVTQDGSLVQKFEVDRHTGCMQPVQ